MYIILESEYISTAVNSLDLYSRIFMGQYDHLNWELRLHAIYEKDNWSEVEHKEEARKTLLMELRNIILPDLQKMGWNASYGIWNFYKNDQELLMHMICSSQSGILMPGSENLKAISLVILISPGSVADIRKPK